MAALRGALTAATSAAASILAYKASFEYTDFGDMIRTMASAAIAGGALLAPPAGAARVAAEDATAAALKASLQTVEMLLRAQGEPSRLGLVLGLLVPAAGGALWHRYGWNAFGWVTPQALSEGLATVSARIGATVSSLGDTLTARLSAVDQKLVETADSVARVEVAQEELRAEVHAVAEGVSQLDARWEARMAPIEVDSRSSAQGVAVLCELVATSGLLANASPDALHRLDAFTAGGPSPPPQLEAAAPSAPRLGQAAPHFVRSLLSDPPGVQAR